MTDHVPDFELWRDRLRELASGVDFEEDMRVLREIADWLDDQAHLWRALSAAGGTDFATGASPEALYNLIHHTAVRAHDTKMGAQFDESWEAGEEAAKNDDAMRAALRKAAEKAGREVFFSEEAKPGLTYTDTPFGPMGVNLSRYYPDVRETLEAQGETLTALAVAGGQGRTAASVEDDAVGMFAIIAWVVIVVLLALAAGVFWVVLA
jgi:hypothetical protein